MKTTISKKHIANNFNELCDAINEIEMLAVKHAKDFNTYPTLWFRGHSDMRWMLVPSIQRLNGSSLESVLCHSFYHGVSQISGSRIPRTAYDQWLPMM